jgi:hypothetical protein
MPGKLKNEEREYEQSFVFNSIGTVARLSNGPDIEPNGMVNSQGTVMILLYRGQVDH